MSNTRVERMRYYGGEYLRSNDFQTEQGYHLEMRRRLNLILHLYGVAYGMQLDQDPDSHPPEAPLFDIRPGLAIDQLGREIVIDNPYILRSDEVLSKKGMGAGKFELWICYREDPNGLPAAGYALCNDPGQNTRITESFDIVLVQIPKPPPQKGLDTVDPDTGRKGIRLGTIDVDPDPGGGFLISGVHNEYRTYAGICAQRLVAPDTTADTFSVVARNETHTGGPLPGYVDVTPSVFVRGNLMAHQNAVVGPDFEVKAADAFSSLPADLSDPGDLKVANYLILQKGMIASFQGKWYQLDEYLASRLPEFVVDSATIDVDPANTPPAPITKQSSLPSVKNATVMVSMSGLVLKGKNDLNIWWGTLNGGANLDVEVSGIATRQGASLNSFDITFSYTAQPKDNPAIPANAQVEVQKIIVNYMVVFYP